MNIEYDKTCIVLQLEGMSVIQTMEVLKQIMDIVPNISKGEVCRGEYEIKMHTEDGVNNKND